MDTTGADQIFRFIEQTFEDRIFDPDEKRKLSRILEQANLPGNRVSQIRNDIFKFAQRQVSQDETETRQLITWLSNVIKVLVQFHREDSEMHSVHFSPEGDCCEIILDCLRKAEKELQICVYTISDDRLANEVIRCYKKGLKVRLITDDEKVKDIGSDIKRIARNGIDVRVDDIQRLMHHKFTIVDRKKLITGSYNWTTTAAKSNYENILITSKKQVVKAYEDEFERLWNELYTFKPGS